MDPKHHHLISFDNILRTLLFQNRFFKGINNQKPNTSPESTDLGEDTSSSFLPVQAAGCVAGDHSAGNQRPMESVRWEKLTHLLVGCLLDFFGCAIFCRSAPIISILGDGINSSTQFRRGLYTH